MQPEQRGLAAARRPDDRDELPGRRSIRSSGCRMVSGRSPLVTVFETPRSSIMTARDGCRAAASSTCQTRVGDDPRALRRSDGCRRPGSARRRRPRLSSRNGMNGDAVLAGEVAEDLAELARVAGPKFGGASMPARSTAMPRSLARLDDLRRGSASARRPAGRAGRRCRRARRPGRCTSPSSDQSSRLQAAGRRVAGDAGVDDLVLEPGGVELLLQQRRIRLSRRRPRPAVRLSPRTTIAAAPAARRDGRHRRGGRLSRGRAGLFAVAAASGGSQARERNQTGKMERPLSMDVPIIDGVGGLEVRWVLGARHSRRPREVRIGSGAGSTVRRVQRSGDSGFLNARVLAILRSR